MRVLPRRKDVIVQAAATEAADMKQLSVAEALATRTKLPILNRATLTWFPGPPRPKHKPVSGQSKSRSQTKRLQTATSDRLLSNRSRTGRGKPKPSEKQPEYRENYQGLFKVGASVPPGRYNVDERGECLLP